MAVLSLIFSQLFRRSIENYPIYYLTGYIEADIAAASADYQELTRLLEQKEREDEILLELMAQWEEAAGGLA